MSQTTVQEDDSILFGSAKVEIAPYGTSNWVDIGAADGVKFTFRPKYVTIEFDNTEEWRRYANADEAIVSGTFYELSAANINEVLRGIGVYGQTTGAPGQTVTDEAVVLDGTEEVSLAKRMPFSAGEPAEVTITNVDSLAGAGGTSYTRAGSATGGDYVITLKQDGRTCIARTTDSDITDGQTVYVSYTYTTVTADTLDIGGITALSYVKVRLTNRRPSDSKDYIVLGHKATLDGDLGWTYGKDGDQKPYGCPFSFKLTKDTLQANQYQLFQITDQQSVV